MKVFLCAINNVLSGTCNEDCAFCTQSVKFHADIQRYTYKSIEQIVSEAKLAKEMGALGYCLVTAGKGLDDKKTEFIAKSAVAIKKEVDGLHLIGCNGTASLEQLKYLKSHGIDSYNHNLETSSSYYNKICSTHTWHERYQTCLNVKSVDLSLCSGGIFGMGESTQDRDELINAIVLLEPDSIPINFFHPNDALPIKSTNITLSEGVEIIARIRKMAGDQKMLMAAGGRELLFGGHEHKMFEAGINSIVIGDYLTTKGEDPNCDRKMIENLGYEIAIIC
ncbi:MAG TPA: biotin synthase [Epsilonproteobacteria bacterium]|nr:biotin synthase [Campylobacterota bacterium]